MKNIVPVLVAVTLVSSSAWAATNPARQAALQRGSQSPADGIWHVYDRNGVLVREENYRNYRLHGDVRSFYPSGALKEAMSYVDGDRQGPVKTYFESGALQLDSSYEDNNLNGPSRRYYETGELESVFTFDRGNLDGEKKTYYKNGAIKQSANYRDGVLNGVVINYAQDGAIVSEEQYRDALLISRREPSSDTLVSGKVITAGPKAAATEAKTPAAKEKSEQSPAAPAK